jgi:hypothetical protein
VIPTITVDATKALARFSRAGIPEDVRNNLRRILPDLTKRLSASVEDKLDTELRSRRRLEVRKLMREDPTKIIGQVQTVATAEPRMLPRWLDTGTRPHLITARNASALFFFWEKMGRWVSFHSVWHPGFPGLNYMQRSFQEMEDEIFRSIEEAARSGAREAA